MSDSRIKQERRPTPHDVLWVYRILLGRDPENRSVVDQATKASSIDDLRYSVFRSFEFQEKFSGKYVNGETGKYAYANHPDLRAETVWHSLLSKREVSLAYNVILGRDIESETVAEEHVQTTPNLLILIESLLNSPEYQSKIASRILLNRFERWVSTTSDNNSESDVLMFGAFENGNLGDICQAGALKTCIDAVVPGPNALSVQQCSWERVGGTAPAAARTPFDEILSPERLRKYRLLVVGGGGLLATPHFPLFVRSWVDGLNTIGLPYIIVGVGASAQELQDPERTEGYRSLIANAAFVSGRDRESLEALSSFRPDISFILDPYFAFKFDPERKTKRETDCVRVLLVPKIPINDSERTALDYLLNIQRHCGAVQIDCDTVFFEPELDQSIAYQFPFGKPIAKVADFLRYLTEDTIVYSMRYHGIIFSLCHGSTCWALGAKKNINLYEEIGISDFAITDGSSSTGDFKMFGDSHWKKIASYHQSGRSGLDALTEALHNYLPG